jgi:segregation and condensation protein B
MMPRSGSPPRVARWPRAEIGGIHRLAPYGPELTAWPGHCAGDMTSRRRWSIGVATAGAAARDDRSAEGGTFGEGGLRLATVGDAETSPAKGDSRGEEIEDEPPVVRRKRSEAVLLFHRGPVNLRKLAALAELADATEAKTRIRELNDLYDQSGSALRVEEVAGGYQLLTRPSLAPWLRRIKHVPPVVQLGGAAMETLAIIAYRQPVLRADVEAIRGVACGELIRQLMQRDLVRICGRSEELGRPYLYGTTTYFLQIFGLKNVGSIPALAGASIPDDSEDTLPNQDDPGQAIQSLSPIEPPIDIDHPVSAISPLDAVTPKESDVSIAPGPVVIDEVAEIFKADSNIATAEPLWTALPRVVAIDDDEDEEFFDDDEEDEVVVDDDEDDDWDDEDDDVEDDDAEDEWEEVGDEDEVEDEEEEEVEVEVDDIDAEEEEEVEDELEEDDEWEDDEDDDDWEEDDEEEEWD